jgi:uncharacterized membrane protein
MLREYLFHRLKQSSSTGRERGAEVSRIEAFSDAVFGFAITLLVVSVAVSKSFSELMVTMRGFGAFALSFCVLFHFWKAQHDFFRTYGLNDNITIWLNAVLMFLVIFFIYPLKFLFTWVVNLFSGVPNVHPGPGGKLVPVIEGAQLPNLMTVYGLGLAAVMTVFVLLHVHAYRRRQVIGLDAREAYACASQAMMYGWAVALPLISVAVARLGGPTYCFWAGMIYFLLGPLMGLTMAVRGRFAPPEFLSKTLVPAGDAV